MIAEQEMEKGMMVLKIIWSTMLLSLGIYLLVGRLAAPAMPSTLGEEAFGTLRMIVLALAIAALIASGYIRRLILVRPSAPMPKYTSAVIASLAMSESVGIFGLVLFLLGKNEADLYLLLGISAAAMIYHRPKREELAGLFREQS